MQLKSTRKIMSIILAVVIALGAVMFSFSTVLSSTFAKKSFIVKHIVTNELVDECDRQLGVKFEALERKTGIPARVFETVKQSYSTRDALLQSAEYMFDENDSTLYNDNRVDYFYGLCVEYLEGNEFKYNEKNVRVIADEAARIYSDSVGIHNADEIGDYVEHIHHLNARVQSVGLMLVVVGVVLLLVLFKKLQEAILYIGAGIMAGGISTFFGAIVAIVTKAGNSPVVSPMIYQQSFASMVTSSMTRLVLAGLMVLVLGVLAFAYGAYKINLEQSRKDNRFSKIIVKL